MIKNMFKETAKRILLVIGILIVTFIFLKEFKLI